MKQPLFAVGEVVILQSKNPKVINGEHSVIAIPMDDQLFKCPITGNLSTGRTGDSYSYVLDYPHIDEDSRNKTCFFFAEQSLRKKHQPGEQSFSELMSNLKMGQPA